ncbi:hypothetical protein RB614_32170 [Phytohabitans sp. ZYX-F-186]|uniref:SUKH-4 immunity protein of toxin-antitoxin system n=1 Tax=Phytohabitans maris TaxID=3071409 RepID=A0ABU0ZQE9_9ACTN|nr:hypothetical protein [Phytohabitans sp. ZYX-F-186]MDQ7909188.1 hypothetical protein [Phytohabitans sp. ZYX-F-186]
MSEPFTTDAAILDRIRSTPSIAKLLTDFDFDIERVANGPVEEVHLASGEPLEMVAGDASGGAFMLVGGGDERPVVYVGSEGEGGLIATSLRDALALIGSVSSIHDATARPLGDDGGAALRSWLAEADEEVREDWPDLDANRVRLREALDLPAADGLLEALHRLAADEAYRPISEAGDRYQSML